MASPVLDADVCKPVLATFTTVRLSLSTEWYNLVEESTQKQSECDSSWNDPQWIISVHGILENDRDYDSSGDNDALSFLSAVALVVCYSRAGPS